ncbi:hypothetical protein ACFVTF_33880 [Kitasatospora sp. NPDC057940]|uniref:hypothetical protein n=1 Tax=Kitasatospora sp. NPDC057940 TaxID=3346285 RepID=UPI0036DD05B8
MRQLSAPLHAVECACDRSQVEIAASGQTSEETLRRRVPRQPRREFTNGLLLDPDALREQPDELEETVADYGDDAPDLADIELRLGWSCGRLPALQNGRSARASARLQGKAGEFGGGEAVARVALDLGGTGAYRTISGDGTLEYTTADDTTIILNYSVQQGAGS